MRRVASAMGGASALLRAGAPATPSMYVGALQSPSTSTSPTMHHGALVAAGPRTALRHSSYFAWFDWKYLEYISVYHWVYHYCPPIVDYGVGAIAVVQGATGLPWPAMMFGLGFCIRLGTLYLSMVGERAGARMALAEPELAEVYRDFDIAYKDPKRKSYEVSDLTRDMNKRKREIHRRFNTSAIAMVAPFGGLPILYYGFQVCNKALAQNEALAEAPFFHCLSMATADPLFILPAVATGLTLFNIHMALTTRRENREWKGWKKEIRGVSRAGAVILFPLVINLRSGFVLYWIGLSTCGLLQPALVRVAAFRRWFGIPDLPAEEREDFDVLKTALKTSAPAIHNLFDPSTAMAYDSEKKKQELVDSARPDSPQPPSARSIADRVQGVHSGSKKTGIPIGNPLGTGIKTGEALKRKTTLPFMKKKPPPKS